MGMFKVLVAILAIAPVSFVTEAIAEMQAPPSAGQKPSRPGAQTPTQGEEQEVEGQVKSVDPSGKELILTDGTKLVTPPGAAIRPGLREGTTVIASYREENGQKVLTELVVKEPAASPPTEPRSSPGGPPAAPPSDSPKRY